MEETKEYNRYVAIQYVSEQASNIKVLSKDASFISTDYKAESIEMVLAEYTKTSFFFQDNYILPTIAHIKNVRKNFQDCTYDDISTEKLEVFTKLIPIKIEEDLNVLRQSFSNIFHAIEFTPNFDTENEIYRVKIKDINALPTSILQIWKLSHGIEQLWRMFGLQAEFKQQFANEQLFWN